MMADNPRLSILIPWYKRDELLLTLAANAPVFRVYEAEVLVLNCGGDRSRLRQLIAASGVPGVRQLDIAAPRFNKSLALNVGLSRSKFDNVLTLDADVVLLDDTLAAVEAVIDEHSFATIEWVYESEPALPSGSKQQAIVNNSAAPRGNSASLELRFRDGTSVQHQLSRRGGLDNARAGTGLLLARKHDLLRIQGYNSELKTWGWEDDDVVVRLQYVLRLRRVQKGTALHLTHGDDRRVLLGSRRHSDQMNFLRCCRNYNNGLFLGTFRADEAWAADKVTEMPAGFAVAEPGVAAADLINTSPLPYCGNENGMCRESRRDWSSGHPSIDQLLLEATVKKAPLRTSDILYLETGHSALATRLSAWCHHITGVVPAENQRPISATLELQNYQLVVCNKYNEDFSKHLPLGIYDIIVDNDLAAYPCCRRHLNALMDNYLPLLAPAGMLVTAQPSKDSGAADGRVKLTEADLLCLASQFGLYLERTGYGVYVLRKEKFP